MEEVEEHAGFGVRLIASIVDTMILIIPVSVVIAIYNGHFSVEWSKGYGWEIFYILYLIILPVIWGGYVIGKRLLKIKIKRMDQKELTLLNMFLREAVGWYLLAIITLGISIIVSVFMVIFREDKRGLHDLIGGTYVSKRRKITSYTDSYL